jgi:hypothetical protein
MDRHTDVVNVIEESLRKYTDSAGARDGGRIDKEKPARLRNVPAECLSLRPAMLAWNELAKKVIIFEVACPFAEVKTNGDTIPLIYD